MDCYEGAATAPLRVPRDTTCSRGAAHMRNFGRLPFQFGSGKISAVRASTGRVGLQISELPQVLSKVWDDVRFPPVAPQKWADERV